MLVVYKGYEKEFLEKNIESSLTGDKVEEKINIDNTKKETAKKVLAALLSQVEELESKDKWITYEEFSASYSNLLNMVELYNIKIVINNNNKYYNIYPLEIYDKENLEKLINKQNENNNEEDDVDSIYSYVYELNGTYFVQYHNYEYDHTDTIEMIQRYNGKDIELQRKTEVDYIFEIGTNIEDYVQNMIECIKHKKIGIIMSIENSTTLEMYNGLVGFLTQNDYEVYKYANQEKITKRHEEYVRIAKEEIGIPDFKNFKLLDIYKNPSLGNEITQISQEIIIDEIVNQIERSKENEENYYRDIFVTAPTGAGKSVMFQIPAVYAAKKYQSVTIVISPLVELMNDQVYNLKARGYNRAARLNSDVNAFEKQEIIENIDKGNIDILYLSPEALLSYSIESIIGSRDISTIIVDEAHIVTTWGQGFRPDYWYLGTYIERLRKYRYKNGRIDKNAKIYKFPVCTFTATAVFGGEDDGVNEITESLYLKDPVKYIGKVKREDITFDIKVHNNEFNMTETNLEKAKDLKNRILSWQEKGEKSLVYFPYNSIAKEAFYKKEAFEILDDKKIQDIGIYTGQIDKTLKKESANQYKNGEIKTMFATKAFGMGIDIKDIKNVYHYAEAGNLNDYVQEIGRAARAENITGVASMDYYLKDSNYSKILIGMSAIRQSDIENCIRVLNNTYKRTKRRNNLITPQAFETVFPNTNSLETSVKTALLNIEKDFQAKYRIPVIITRPRAMFTNAFIVIDKQKEQEILNSKYGKYFKKESGGRKRERESNCIVSDLGDVFYVNLKSMWEEKFSDLSFANFKYKFYQERDKILGEYEQFIYPRMKLVIQMIDETSSFVGITNKLLENINLVSEILAKFQMEQGEFTIQQLKTALKEVFKNSVIADNIANGYFKIIEPKDQIYSKPFYTTKRVGEIVKYRITNSSYRPKAESIVFKSRILKELEALDTNKVEKYKNTDKKSIESMTKILNLLSMFNIIQYDMYGGENPEIFVRINDPVRIRAIAEGDVKYKNSIVEKARSKHKRDVEVLEKFIVELKTDEERWNYIEDYFLGKGVFNEGENE